MRRSFIPRSFVPQSFMPRSYMHRSLVARSFEVAARSCIIEAISGFASNLSGSYSGVILRFECRRFPAFGVMLTGAVFPSQRRTARVNVRRTFSLVPVRYTGWFPSGPGLRDGHPSIATSKELPRAGRQGRQRNKRRPQDRFSPAFPEPSCGRLRTHVWAGLHLTSLAVSDLSTQALIF